MSGAPHCGAQRVGCLVSVGGDLIGRASYSLGRPAHGLDYVAGLPQLLGYFHAARRALYHRPRINPVVFLILYGQGAARHQMEFATVIFARGRGVLALLRPAALAFALP
jgi:hypothetical protein